VFEAVVLQLILLAFVGTGIESSRRIRSALVGNRASVQATGQKVWLQVMGTTVFIFVTFLLRSVFHHAGRLLRRAGLTHRRKPLRSPIPV
jgi:hypothetical protein